MNERFVPDTIMIVEWLDPDTATGWATPEEAVNSSQGRVVSVGMFVRETEDCIILAMDWEAEGLVNSRGRIYKNLIQRVKVLKFPVAYTKEQKKK